MANHSIGPERHHLARQVQDFRYNAKKLKKIFKDTVRVLSDLQEFEECLSIESILAVQGLGLRVHIMALGYSNTKNENTPHGRQSWHFPSRQ
jgi:hypothetical protein